MNAVTLVETNLNYFYKRCIAVRRITVYL